MKLSEICICVGNLKLFSSVVQGRKVKLKIFMCIYFKGRFQVSFRIKFLVLPLTLLQSCLSLAFPDWPNARWFDGIHTENSLKSTASHFL